MAPVVCTATTIIREMSAKAKNRVTGAGKQRPSHPHYKRNSLFLQDHFHFQKRHRGEIALSAEFIPGEVLPGQEASSIPILTLNDMRQRKTVLYNREGVRGRGAGGGVSFLVLVMGRFQFVAKWLWLCVLWSLLRRGGGNSRGDAVSCRERRGEG